MNIDAMNYLTSVREQYEAYPYPPRDPENEKTSLSITAIDALEKINHYSTGLVADKQRKGRRANPWIMIFYPPLFFIRLYFFKRQFLNGWAGLISAKTGAFYAFLKYAKLYESARKQRQSRGDSGR